MSSQTAFEKKPDPETEELLTKAFSMLKAAGMSKSDAQILLLLVIRKEHLKMMVKYLSENPKATPEEIDKAAEKIALMHKTQPLAAERRTK